MVQQCVCAYLEPWEPPGLCHRRITVTWECTAINLTFLRHGHPLRFLC
jgi:hypothetical protein